ncbi:hypothetical protein RclHR1_01930013 [Rhizophagus clarus]|uniref:Uncharacterized protein n=1 Tax=Rhizophagus clarus TaxID=94130 RepID=A0A2Z6R4H3_9GLOM|nr:hypothetical protein RclHR1_01930013 [Rhizophagus clarus]GES87072.1 hypothetical protein RCL_jg20960.t1 [Rhizophagus clarus]
MSANRFLYELIELKDIKSFKKYSDGSEEEEHAKDVTTDETVKENPTVSRFPKALYVDQYGHEFILLQDLKSKI